MEGPAPHELTGDGRRVVGVAAAVRAVLARPRLWPAALRQVRVLVPPGWWRRPPFVPLPSRDWLRFRMTTAYGDPDAPVDVEDLLVWLAWTDTVRPARAVGGPGSGARRAPGSHAGSTGTRR